jgi:hypothetical protein
MALSEYMSSKRNINPGRLLEIEMKNTDHGED